MTRTRKYLIIILTLLTALLCAVGASTWIITSPTSFSPKWDQGKKAVYIKRTAEDDFSESGIAVADLTKHFEFCDENGDKITDEENITVDLSEAKFSNGDISQTGGTIEVGSTYSISDITVKLNRDLYYLVGTYSSAFSKDEPLTQQGIDFKNDYIKQDSDTDYIFTNFLYKYKTVYQGTPSSKNNPTYNTIEDALTSWSGTISIEAGKTSFTALSDSVTGYSSSGRTLSSGKTLLVPYSASDSGSTKEISGTGDPKAPYATLVIPDRSDDETDFTISGGTLNVNGLRTTTSNGQVTDNGQMEVKAKAKVSMTSGTWETIGYTYGDGSIDVSGGSVYETFSMPGWKGGSISLGICDDVFPINQFCINSIICKTTIHNTATYTVKACIDAGTITVDKDLPFISSNNTSFLQMTSGYIVKWVDEESGTIHFETHGALTFNNISMVVSEGLFGIGRVELTTTGKTMPLPGNYAITVAEGVATVPSEVSLKLLPGATLEVAKGATIEVRGAAYAYSNAVTVYSKPDGSTGWTDSNSWAYPNAGSNGSNVKKTYRPDSLGTGALSYSAATDAKVQIDAGAKITVKNGGTIGANILGTSNEDIGATLEFENGANVSGSIKEDFTKSGEISSTSAALDHNLGTRFTATLSAKGELSTGFGNFETGKTYTYYQDAWRENTSYTVNYHANGDNVTGINEADGIHSVTVGDNILEGATYDWSSTAPIVSRAHYTFGGWYTNEDCTAGSEASGNILGGQTIDLYAKWTPVKYTVKYVIDGYSDYTLDTTGFTEWTIEKTFDLSALIPTGLPANVVFVGWYIDSGFSLQVTALDKDQINHITPSADNIITLYGQVNRKVQYSVHYDYSGKPTDDGDNYAKDKTGIIDETDKFDTGANVNSDYIDALYTEEKVNDNNTERQYYFLGWFDEAGNSVPSGATIQETMDANSDGEITFTAKWAKKAHVTVTGEYTNNERDGYYKANDPVDLSDMYELVTAHDYDVNVSTYFSGWSVTGGTGSVEDNTYTVAANGEEVTIVEGRTPKAILIVNVSGKSTLKLQVSDIAQWSSLTEVINGQYYLKPETIVKYEISSTAQNGSGMDPTNATWSWSIKGAATGDGEVQNGNGEMKDVSGEFTMPDSDSTVTVKADSSNGTCIVEGTLIMMADGTQKPVEEVKAGDEIIVFNHETGKYEKGKIWFTDHEGLPREWYTVVRLKFSDGSEIGISYRHAFFDLDLNKYVYIDEFNYEEFIGHRFTSVKQANGEFVSGEVKLISGRVASEYVRVFSPLSEYHFNMVTDGLLTIASFNYGETGFFNFFEFGEGMKYDETKMQADIAKYGLFTYEEFKDLITYDIWCKAPVQYLKISIAKGLMTFEDIELTVQWLIDKGFFE